MLATQNYLEDGQGEEGEDYYNSIKDVIDRINERRNSVESSAADLFRRAHSRPVKTHSPSSSEPEPTFRPKRRKAEGGGTPTLLMKSPTKSPHKLDLSWKNAGEDVFPKKSSSLGDEFQATQIPEAGSFHKEDNPSSDS